MANSKTSNNLLDKEILNVSLYPRDKYGKKHYPPHVITREGNLKAKKILKMSPRTSIDPIYNSWQIHIPKESTNFQKIYGYITPFRSASFLNVFKYFLYSSLSIACSSITFKISSRSSLFESNNFCL